MINALGHPSNVAGNFFITLYFETRVHFVATKAIPPPTPTDQLKLAPVNVFVKI